MATIGDTIGNSGMFDSFKSKSTSSWSKNDTMDVYDNGRNGKTPWQDSGGKIYL